MFPFITVNNTCASHTPCCSRFIDRRYGLNVKAIDFLQRARGIYLVQNSGSAVGPTRDPTQWLLLCFHFGYIGRNMKLSALRNVEPTLKILVAAILFALYVSVACKRIPLPLLIFLHDLILFSTHTISGEENKYAFFHKDKSTCLYRIEKKTVMELHNEVEDVIVILSD